MFILMAIQRTIGKVSNQDFKLLTIFRIDRIILLSSVLDPILKDKITIIHYILMYHSPNWFVQIQSIFH